MKVAVFDRMEECTEAEVQRLLPLVSAQRREQALKYKHTFGQFCCLKSWLMLMNELGNERMSELGEWTAFAISRDGYNYEDILEGKAIMDVNEHARIEGGQRDAYITRSYDGKGYVMVNTDMCVAKSKVWDNYGIDLLKSDDLINWTSVTFDFRKGPSIFMDPDSESVYKDFSAIRRVWAPQIFWDPNYEWSN